MQNEQSMQHKIIVFEGLDAAGKSTQKDLLKESFNKLALKYKDLHFPKLNGGYHGTLVAEFLRGEFGSVENVHPKLVATLFALDRKEHMAQMVEWLEAGNWLIMDRYVNSNIAFQCAKLPNDEKKAELKRWILDYEYSYHALPTPGQSFFLDVPIEFIEQSLAKEREGEDRQYLNGKKDIHENSMELQRNVRQEYLKMVDEQKDFHKINCSDSEGHFLSAEEIHQKVAAYLTGMLAESS